MKTHHVRRILAAFAIAVPGFALAQTWPARPITLVVPVNPGAVIDATSRLIAKFLGERLGQAIVVDNKPGNSGNIGASFVAGAPPDGYTLLIAASNLSMAPYLTKGLPWDPEKDFVPLAMPTLGPLVLFANNDLNVQTLPDLLALAKAQPGKINYGSSGKGTPHHLAMAQLQQASGTDLYHVPFKSIGEMVTSVVGGHVQLGFAAPGNILGLARSGKLKMLAVSAPSRLPQLPEIPTLRELGLEKAEVEVWVGLFAPGKTPPEIVSRLTSEMDELMKRQDYKDGIGALGMVVPSPGNAEYLASQMRKDRIRMPQLLKAAAVTSGSN